ncbi:MAG TPA: SMC family ATPase [Nitrososphaerales archaeon]|nr:SMC family ATPase [Nitrososphaerales archaeon]
MILKSLTLQNFRSYGEIPTEIKFERGISLFEGDIGSGKSSILYAIEFALFGLGDIEARSILRSSASTAKVELEFEVGGRDYRVVRTVEHKGASKMLVTKGWLSSGEMSTLEELAPTELKTRILQILNFREKPGKSTSRIFRFAIFTPQELMREVLSQRPDERIETLRRAFGIEDYSFAMENAEVASRELRGRSQIHAGLSKSLPEKEEARSKLEAEISSGRDKLTEKEKSIEQLESDLATSKATLESLETARDEAKKLQALIPELERNLEQFRAQLQKEKSHLDLLKKDLSEIKKAKSLVETLAPVYTKYLSATESVNKLDHLRDEELALDKKISEIKNTISSRQSGLRAELLSRQDDMRRCESTLRSLEETLNEKPELEKRLSELEVKLGEAEGLEQEIDIVKSETASLSSTCSSIAREIENTNSQFRKMDGLKKESTCPLCGQKLDQEHVSSLSHEFSKKIGALNSEFSDSNSRLEELKSRLKNLEKEKSSLERAKGEYDVCSRRLAALEQTFLMRQRQAKELLEIKTRIDAVREKLGRGDVVGSPEEESELEALEKKKMDLAPELATLRELKAFTQRCVASEVEKKYLGAQARASREAEVLDLIKREEERFAEIEDSATSKSKEMRQNQSRLEALEPKIYEYSRLKETIDSMESRRNEQKSGFDGLSATLAVKEQEFASIKSEVELLRKEAERASLLRAVVSWIDSLFIPTVRDIETYVLDSINEEFEKVFQRWFSILVEEGDITVTLDDRFTPLVEQAGYELDVQSLSGGERTAVALAYRLALNFMVRRASGQDALATTNLLILDEPTEGFSKEQIYRLRNVLEDLDADQVIIVSHERDLETMADHVYRVEKIGGQSQVKLILAA